MTSPGLMPRSAPRPFGLDSQHHDPAPGGLVAPARRVGRGKRQPEIDGAAGRGRPLDRSCCLAGRRRGLTEDDGDGCFDAVMDEAKLDRGAWREGFKPSRQIGIVLDALSVDR